MMHFSNGSWIIFANSEDPDEMPHHASFNLGLHCLPKYQFADIQKGELDDYKWEIFKWLLIKRFEYS